MLKNYLKVAFRNLRRSPGYSLINVFSLAIGLACSVLILLFIYDELRYDAHHENADHIYRVTKSYTQGNHWAAIGPPVGAALVDGIPEIEASARFRPFGVSDIFTFEDRSFEERNGVMADTSMFDIFSIPLKRGSERDVLKAPYSIVLSESMAQKYFGSQDPLDKLLEVNGGYQLRVTGVMEDLPATTHMPFDFMVSMSTFYEFFGGDPDQSRTWAGMYTYVKVREGSDVSVVESKLPQFVDAFFQGIYDEPASNVMEIAFQPLRSIYLHSKLEKEYRANSDVIYVYVFSIIAVLVLLIACVNFTNLTTARASNRMREIGIRKTLGSRRNQLALQFMGESMLLSGFALMLAYVIVLLTLPLLNEVTGKALVLDSTINTVLWVGLSGITLLAGLVSGLYPAVHLSRFTPINAFKGASIPGMERTFLKKGLVVFQFSISIFLIASTLVVVDQLDYFKSKQLGFEKEGVVTFSLNGALGEYVDDGNLETFKQELTRHSTVLHASNASSIPGQRFSIESFTVVEDPEIEPTPMRVAWRTDHDYANALGLDIVAGRDFSKYAPADSAAWLVNEAAVREFNLAEPVGKTLKWDNAYEGPIVGVIKDFHFASLHNVVEPLLIPLRPGGGGNMLVRIQTDQIQDALDHIRQTVATISPENDVALSFLGDNMDLLYRSEDRLGKVFRYFSIVAILIACLGLIGLATYTSEQRTKEIGIRKVLGATVASVLVLLSRDFARLVGIAFLVAAPITYLLMDRWLQSFAYQVDLGPGILVMAGALVLMIALMTIGYQALKAALSNPVESLRYE